MKKYGLKVDDLAVESFDTAAEFPARGTVRGYHTHNQAYSACWGTGCDESIGDGDGCAGGISLDEDATCECETYTHGNDNTCINCTAAVANCTADPYSCNVVTEGTCWTQSLCC